MDATEIRVRRPTGKRAGRKRFISGKSRHHAVKALIVSDARGRVLFGRANLPSQFVQPAPLTSPRPDKPAWSTGSTTHPASGTATRVGGV
jgi:hypothetical protein